MSLRYYANAPATTLNGSVTNVATSIVVTSATGFPISYPYTLILDRGTASEEAVSVTAAAGTTLTVTRAIDSTTAFAHASGATVEHGITAQDIREPNSHINTNAGVHGATGSVVGTTDTQTLTNKTLGTTNTINGFTASRFMEADGTGKLVSGTKAIPTGVVVGTSDTQTLTGKTIDLTSNTVTMTKAQLNTAVTDADVVTLTGTETLTNKTVNLASNTVSGTTAQFNTALSDNDFATLAGAETLTNKTLSSPLFSGDFVGGRRFVIKSADESISSSAVLHDDTELSFSVVANATYEVLLCARWTGPTAGGVNFGFTAPTGATYNVISYTDPNNAGTYNQGAQITGGFYNGAQASFGPLTPWNPVAAVFITSVRLVIKTSATAGTVHFQWSQATSNATATICKAGDSRLAIERMA